MEEQVFVGLVHGGCGEMVSGPTSYICVERAFVGCAARESGDEVLKKIAVEITEKLRASTSVDWQVRESGRAKLRILVRRCLQKWKYPPDKQLEAVELVLKQAESLSSSWTV